MSLNSFAAVYEKNNDGIKSFSNVHISGEQVCDFMCDELLISISLLKA
jgi:hypothetical protein